MAYLLSRYARIFEKNGHWWLFHSPTGIAAQFTDDFIETPEFAQLRSQRAVEESDHEVVHTMRQYSILVEDQDYAQEEARLEQALRQYIHNEESFELILLPTEKCNFRCPYCYEDFQLGRMSEEVVRRVKRLISREAARPGRKQLRISWFGGEPLVAKDIVFDITEHALNTAEKHHLHFSADMTTNGYYLTPAIFEKLVKRKVDNFQITVDGPPDIHNQTRILFNGRGTFDRIWNNLQYMHQSQARFSVLFRMNVHNGNYDAIKAWIPELAKTFLGEDARFRIHFHPVFAPDLRDKADSPHARQIQALYGAAHDAKLLTDVDFMFAPFGSICYAARANHFVIRSNGRINKCTVAFGVPENDVGELTEDGELALNPHFRLWVRDTLTHPKCRSCPVAYQCGGHASCPLKAIIADETRRYCIGMKQTDLWLPLLATQKA